MIQIFCCSPWETWDRGMRCCKTSFRTWSLTTREFKKAIRSQRISLSPPIKHYKVNKTIPCNWENVSRSPKLSHKANKMRYWCLKSSSSSFTKLSLNLSRMRKLVNNIYQMSFNSLNLRCWHKDSKYQINLWRTKNWRSVCTQKPRRAISFPTICFFCRRDATSLSNAMSSTCQRQGWVTLRCNCLGASNKSIWKKEGGRWEEF